MNFRRKFLLALALPATVVVGMGAGTAIGVWRFEQGLERFFVQEQPLAEHSLAMYAEGLQMGQALRNILIDPANRTAYDNLKVARAGFDKARDGAEAAARATAHAGAVAKVTALRGRLAEVQARVLDVAAKDNAAAFVLLRKEETPTWRELRGALLALKKEAGTAMAASRVEATSSLDQAKKFALGLTLLCALACGWGAWRLLRLLDRELGCDPEMARQVLSAIEQGDLSQKVPVCPGDSASVMFAVRHMQEHLVQLVSRVRRNADTLSAASDRISQGNHDLSSRTDEQASALEETSATMEQLSATVRQNAQNAGAADRLAKDAFTVAGRGGEVVGQMVDSMRALHESARRIADITGMIDAIAFQTNLLALNAAVEAARAGEQGRGFAVVASEVRNLAQRSATAAREIKGLIGQSVEGMEKGVALADQAGVSMREVVDAIRRVSGIVADISTASAEQSNGVSQVGDAIVQMDHGTQRNATLVEESAAAADSLRELAHEMAQSMAHFRLATA